MVHNDAVKGKSVCSKFNYFIIFPPIFLQINRQEPVCINLKINSNRQPFSRTDKNSNGDIGYWVEGDYIIPDDTARKTDNLPLSMYVADNI